MANLLTMPSLSPTMETGVISAWQKKVGDFIEVGEVLAEIETDKAVMEYEMADEGFLRELLVEPGKEISVGTPIAILSETKDEDITTLLAQVRAGGAPAAAPAPKAEAEAAPAPGPAPEATVEPAAASAPAVEAPAKPAAQAAPDRMDGERIKISPYARKLAEERRVDWRHLQGSGPGGRIVARDVEGAPASAAAAPGAPAMAPAAAPGVPYEDVPLSMMRKAIARKMAESKTTVPHFQLTRKVRADQLVAAREALNARFGDLKVSVNDVIVKACAVALRHHPGVNSQFLGDKVRRFNTVDIAVAVGTEDGLITPVLRDADRKGLRQISAEVRALAAKAREKQLAPEEYQGGTFTVSNLGMYGVYEFNAIINTPQACILAVSAVVTEPVVEGDRLVVGQTLNMTLSSDHRVVDGVAAAQFMETLVRLLENPLAMLL